MNSGMVMFVLWDSESRTATSIIPPQETEGNVAKWLHLSWVTMEQLEFSGQQSKAGGEHCTEGQVIKEPASSREVRKSEFGRNI